MLMKQITNIKRIKNNILHMEMLGNQKNNQTILEDLRHIKIYLRLMIATTIFLSHQRNLPHTLISKWSDNKSNHLPHPKNRMLGQFVKVNLNLITISAWRSVIISRVLIVRRYVQIKMIVIMIVLSTLTVIKVVPWI